MPNNTAGDTSTHLSHHNCCEGTHVCVPAFRYIGACHYQFIIQLNSSCQVARWRHHQQNNNPYMMDNILYMRCPDTSVWAKTENTERTETFVFWCRQIWGVLVPVNLGSNPKDLGSTWFWTEIVLKWNRIKTKMWKIGITPWKIVPKPWYPVVGTWTEVLA